MTRFQAAFLSATFFVFGITGCLTPGQRREDTLMREARLFNDDLRWGRWDSMTSSMPPADREPFKARVELVDKELVLGDFEVTAINFQDGNEAANVTVKIDWYWKRDQIVKNSELVQRWEWKAGRWVMTQQRRSRGDRFPLVPEPIKPPDAKDQIPPNSGQGTTGATSK